MKNLIFKILIVISSIGIIIFKLNGFNTWSMSSMWFYLLLSSFLIIFISSIVVLNKNYESVENKISLKFNLNNSSNFRYYLISILSAVLLSIYLGYSYRIPTEEFVEIVKSHSGFYVQEQLNLFHDSEPIFSSYFNYNWKLLIIALVISLIAIFWIRNSILYAVLLNPSIKEKVENDIVDYSTKINLLIKTKMRVIKIRSGSKLKFYLITFISSLLISVFLGFKFKTPNSSLFGEIIRSDKNREDIIDYYSSKASFFGLNKFSFNWELFIILMILFFAIIIFLGNTIYYDRISAFINRIKQK